MTDDETDDDRSDDDEIARHTRSDAGSGLTVPDGRTVARWPCASESGCKNTVEVTAATVAALEACNRVLAARGERLIATHEAVPCDACGAVWHRRQAEACERRRVQIAAHVRELRDPQTPAHRIAVAEDYLLKRANDGRALVMLLRARREGRDADEDKPKRKGKW